MKKGKFNFKDLKGTLSRDEMRKISGGDAIICHKCGAMNPSECYAFYCWLPHTYCDVQFIGGEWYGCTCDGDCL